MSDTVRTIEELKVARDEAEREYNNSMGHGRAERAHIRMKNLDVKIKEQEMLADGSLEKPRVMECTPVTRHQCDMNGVRDKDGNFFPSCKGFSLADPNNEGSGCEYYLKDDPSGIRAGLCTHREAGK